MPKREPLKVLHRWEGEDKTYTWKEFLPMLLERHKDAEPVKIWENMEAMNNEARSNAS